MNSILYSVCAAVNAAAFFYKLRVLRIDRSPAQWALCGNFLTPAVLFTVSIPAVWMATSDLVGVVNFSGIFTQSLATLLAVFQQIVLLHLTYEREVAWRKARPRLIGIGVVLIVMITLFISATHAHESPVDFAVETAQDSPAYLSIYVAAYVFNQIDVCRLCWQHALISPRPWLRRGLRLAALNLPAALVYGACRTADIVAGLFGITGHAWEPLVPFALLTATVCTTLGWTLPDWGPYLTATKHWAYRFYLRRRLTPLHQQITMHVPDPVLELARGDDLRTQLYRMVVEIRDAQWALRLWMTPDEESATRREGEALGLHGDGLLAFIEARQIQSAMHAKARGIGPLDRSITPRLAEPPDLAAELSFQRKIAHHFRQLPAVTAAGGTTPSAAPQEGNRI
ncbi:heme/copper-type cytochrome/quinol oxidase subunit 4 [Streptomyces sp. LBL]|uniref:MAB_1171c family putative transporter n=1 Tax=Streptomyces sp. LBL TaxID=2940562 RepID=UPI0024740D2D|nr:MAB_1171c family putative transporter [Streptomyces sp. LBL]MDH6624337.1 heme/copper-type cytochrome/quinol oxidase subunit 4 [Streptomyces sp. LBL]